MSEIRNIISATIFDRQPAFGDVVKNLTTGKSFTAEIQPIADIGLNEAYGRDPRESDTFHVLDSDAADCVSKGDVLSALGVQFKVLRRSNNPASVQIEFGCQKIVTGKDY